MTSSRPSRKARRQAPDVVKREAVEAARGLLLSAGPAAVTVKAVADALGMSHVNLLYHFGSAGGLQAALMTSMVNDLSDALRRAAEDVLSGASPQGALVDVVFRAFDEGGAGRLAAMLALSGETDGLKPIQARIDSLVAALSAQARVKDEAAARRIRTTVLSVAYLAFADALIGPVLRDVLDLDQAAGQDEAKRVVAATARDLAPM